MAAPLMDLPDFPYHPDPVANVDEANAFLFRCRHCGTHLAYIDLD